MEKEKENQPVQDNKTLDTIIGFIPGGSLYKAIVKEKSNKI